MVALLSFSAERTRKAAGLRWLETMREAERTRCMVVKADIFAEVWEEETEQMLRADIVLLELKEMTQII